jgi:multiple sugar transport system ATP-binding protein
MVVERLGGETFVYVQITPADLVVVQAPGENPVKVHDGVSIALDARSCHVFLPDGSARARIECYPLVD